MNCMESEIGLNLSMLDKNTKLEITTKYSVYCVKIIEGRQATIQGGFFCDPHFHAAAEVIILGSTWDDNILKTDWIGKGMRMQLAGKETSLTSEVEKIEIFAPNDSWSYTL